MRWKIQVTNVETRLSVGIHAHEQAPQRIIVNAAIEAEYAAQPRTIAECVNYEPVYQLITGEWPTRPHVDLLETYVFELLAFIFRQDARIISASVSLRKPDIFPAAESVGVEATWTRADYMLHTQGTP